MIDFETEFQNLTSSRSLALVLAALLGPGPLLGAPADEARIAALEEEIRRMQAAQEEALRKQQILVDEVRRLREDLAAPAEPELKPAYGLGPAASKVYGIERGFSVGGYGQAWYTHLDADGAPAPDRFDMKRFVLYTGYKFSPRLAMNAELEWEHATTGGTGSISVEFATLDWFWKKEVNLRAGLMLVPMGTINETHEPTTYHGNERPEVERQILPTTWRESGIGLFGTLGERLDYRAYLITSGRASKFDAGGIRAGRQNGSESLAEDLSFVLRADYRLDDRTTVGVSYLTGDQGQGEEVQITAGGLKARPDASMQLFEAHARYRHRGLELKAVGAWTRLDDAEVLSAAQQVKGKGPVASRMEGSYVEASYDVMRWLDPGNDDELALFFRFEDLDTQAEVPLGFARDPSRSMNVRTWGLGYKPHPGVVFKLDFRRFGLERGDKPDEINFGIGWTF